MKTDEICAEIISFIFCEPLRDLPLILSFVLISDFFFEFFQCSYSNYNEMLSIFLRKKCAANLITPNLKLDALPTEGKIRIILELMKAIEVSV